MSATEDRAVDASPDEFKALRAFEASPAGEFRRKIKADVLRVFPLASFELISAEASGSGRPTRFDVNTGVVDPSGPDVGGVFTVFDEVDLARVVRSLHEQAVEVEQRRVSATRARLVEREAELARLRAALPVDRRAVGAK